MTSKAPISALKVIAKFKPLPADLEWLTVPRNLREFVRQHESDFPTLVRSVEGGKKCCLLPEAKVLLKWS